MGLFGGKVKVSIGVDQPRAVAGGPVTVRVETRDVDRKVQGARIELAYRNRYWHESRDSDGDRSESRRTTDVVAVSRPVFDGAEGPVDGTRSVTLQLPTTPATCEGMVDWRARVVVDRKGGRDVTAEEPITVLANLDAHAEWAERPAETPAGACSVLVDAAPRMLTPGQVVRGTITVTANETVSARAIRAELVERRNEQDGIVKRTTAAEQKLAEKVELAAGATQQYPFELTVPVDAPPSLAADRNELHWLVRGVVDRRMKSDPLGALEVVVHGAATS